jgi:sulfoxide reductase heme-binding subunit YedZ
MEDDMRSQASNLSGVSLFTLLCSAVLVVSAAVLMVVPGVADATLAVVQVTAWASFVLFTVAFVAPPLASLAPGRFTRALMREHLILVLSFVFSLLLHMLAFATYGALRPALATALAAALFERILSPDTLHALPIALLCAAVAVRLVGRWAQANQRRQLRTARPLPRSWSS